MIIQFPQADNYFFSCQAVLRQLRSGRGSNVFPPYFRRTQGPDNAFGGTTDRPMQPTELEYGYFSSFRPTSIPS